MFRLKQTLMAQSRLEELYQARKEKLKKRKAEKKRSGSITQAVKDGRFMTFRNRRKRRYA